jgi:ATP-dependent Clp endopeptidase proteolytic subunit ClpP
MTMPKHQYRFRGSIAPTKAVKRPVRAEVATPETDDGPTVGKLHIDDVIDSWGGYWGISAKEVNAALDELGDVDEIHLHINSPGGEVYEGIAILNSLRRHPADVTAIVDGLAASAASFIAVGVDKTIMAPNTEMMIHDAWGIALGPAADMHAMGDRLDKLSNNIASMYSSKAGGDQDDWRNAMLAETWYSAQEAVDAGLADEVEGALTEDEAPDDEIVPQDAFDLSVFKHAGRAQAPKPAAPSRAAGGRPDRAAPAPVALEETADERLDRHSQRRLARHNRRASAHA